jgi:hypothetical protein
MRPHMQRVPWLGLPALAACAALAIGCGETASREEPGYGGRGRVPSTRGGAVVLTYDERVAVATYRSAGVIAVYRLNPKAAPAELIGDAIEIDVGADAKPWASVIGADDDTAFVLLRGSRQVVRIRELHGQPRLEAARVDVGAEPTSIAITPSGGRLYVANFGDGTLSMITTGNFEAQQATDLNLPLAKTGVLGPLLEGPEPSETRVWTEADFQFRPGLAHPRALAMTDSGDDGDDDETLYATEFFSQPIPNAETTDPDRGRQGFVWAVDMRTGQLRQEDNPIRLAPLDTGFEDAEPAPTFCFPNQLNAAAVDGERLYVANLCASPRGPVGLGPGRSTDNFRTLVHPTISQGVAVDDLAALPFGRGTVLSRVFEARLENGVAAPGERSPLIPNDLVVTPTADGQRAYFTALGADALYSLEYKRGGDAGELGFIDLQAGGRLPIGLALAAGRRVALVVNDYSDTLAVVSLDDARVVVRRALATPWDRVDPEAREGRRLFVTGLENWSFRGQAYSSCESCHPEGLSDGVVWRFARGPRRTISTASTYYPDRQTRRGLLWTANVDEIHDVEAIVRGVSGGAGGVLWRYGAESVGNDCRLLFDGVSAAAVGNVEGCSKPERTTYRLNGLNGSLASISRQSGTASCGPDAELCDINASPDWDRIDAFIRSLDPPQAPRLCDARSRSLRNTCLDPVMVAAGRELFVSAGCAGCHGGPAWTISRTFYRPSPRNNGALPFDRGDVPVSGLMLDELRGALRTQSYQAGPLAALNPPAVSGTAFFRSFAPAPGAEDPVQAALDYLYGSADQLNCLLRDVGTFPEQLAGGSANLAGVVASGPGFDESRLTLVNSDVDGEVYQSVLALGKDGFNVPSLTGLALAGSYFHAGNALTLEEVFHSTFAGHHQNAVFSPSLALTAADVRHLVSFLLSIDAETEVTAVAPVTNAGTEFDPDLCAQFVEEP